MPSAHPRAQAAPKIVLNGMPLEKPWVGIGVYTSRLIRGLLNHRSAPPFKVLLSPAADALCPWIPEENREVVKAPWFPLDFARGVLAASTFARHAQRHYPEAVFHTTTYHWSPARPRRCVVTMHDAIGRRFPLYLGRMGWRKLWMHACERYARQVSLVLTVSEFSARDLTQYAGIPHEKIRVLYNWVGSEFNAANAASGAERVREKLRLPPRFWLYLGGFDYRKNVGSLIEAYAAASRSLVCPPLVLGGSIPSRTAPPYSDPLGSIRSAGLSPAQIILPGRVPEEDLPGLYAAADLLIYPSLCEGFGLPPAEAMAVGIPVLVSDSSSLPEVVPRVECRFDPSSVDSIADSLRAASANAEQFRCPLRPEFCEAVAVNRYLEFIEEISLA